MLLIILAIVAAIVVVILGLAAAKPNTVRYHRSTTIDAPPDKIFPFLNDFHEWTAWSPWERLDANLQRTYSGAPSGVGAVYEWQGNKKVGKGRMEITESKPSSRLQITLDFIEPFKAHNTTVFTLEARGGGTTVLWDMQGQNIFMGKVMSVFMDMDKLIGKDFETGLANLKAAAEK